MGGPDGPAVSDGAGVDVAAVAGPGADDTRAGDAGRSSAAAVVSSAGSAPVGRRSLGPVRGMSALVPALAGVTDSAAVAEGGGSM